MRPVNKGTSPYISIGKYDQAQSYLENKVGCYCSYCELPIIHIPHVEHKESKNSGGAETDWINLLLSCVYCNSRKLEEIRCNQATTCLWPDNDNTFMAYKYDNGKPVLNEIILNSRGQTVYDKAKKLFEIIKLDNIPKLKDKDRRSRHRIEAFGNALETYDDWLKVKGTDYENVFLRQCEKNALATGFFSIWLTVFKNEPQIKRMLIDKFTGTAQNCFDALGNPIIRVGGNI